MAVTTYTVVEGEVISQVTGGVRRDYVPDPLGSTVALLDDTQSFTDTFEYWPYGEVRSRTGATTTPFQFVGTMGYFRDTSLRTYVRARHYRQNQGRWMTVDPLWPSELAYVYSTSSPSTRSDPSGLWWIHIGFAGEKKARLIGVFNNDLNHGNQALSGFIECLKKYCNTEDGGFDLFEGWQTGSEYSNEGRVDFFIKPGWGPGCEGKACAFTLPGTTADPRPTIYICPRAWTGSCGPLKCVIAHELIHAVGYPIHKSDNMAAFLCVREIPGCENFTAIHAKP